MRDIISDVFVLTLHRIAQRQCRKRREERVCLSLSIWMLLFTQPNQLHKLEEQVEVLATEHEKSYPHLREIIRGIYHLISLLTPTNFILSDISEENLALRNLLRQMSVFLGDEKGRVAERFGMSRDEFTAFVSKSECDTIFQGWNARKNGGGQGSGGGMKRRTMKMKSKAVAGGGNEQRTGTANSDGSVQQDHVMPASALNDGIRTDNDNNAYIETLLTPDTPNSFISPTSASSCPIYDPQPQPCPVPIAFIGTPPLTVSTSNLLCTESSTRTNPSMHFGNGYPDILNPPT